MLRQLVINIRTKIKHNVYLTVYTNINVQQIKIENWKTQHLKSSADYVECYFSGYMIENEPVSKT